MPLSDLFPTIRFDYTTRQNLDRIDGELKEANQAYASGTREEFLGELVDVVHQALTTMRVSKYTPAEIDEAVERTIKKNMARGYYKPNEDPNQLQLPLTGLEAKTGGEETKEVRQSAR